MTYRHDLNVIHLHTNIHIYIDVLAYIRMYIHCTLYIESLVVFFTHPSYTYIALYMYVDRENMMQLYLCRYWG